MGMQKFFSFLIILFTVAVNAQEKLVPAGLNQVLITSEKAKVKQKNASQLIMPFYEDFSSTRIYPDPKKFSDSSVFINNSYAVSPFTIGVATFDGLDKNGFIYSHGSSYAFFADTLTSLEIRLDSVFSGTQHKTTPADSIYFSFFYQPQGVGEKPEKEDSLFLEFYAANQNKWIKQWAKEGTSYDKFLQENGSPWKCVMIPIVDTAFMNSNFKFRFMNLASYADWTFPTWASNCDFWNIDYIYINSERNLNDTIPNDLAFRGANETLLKNYYSMPWNHFKANVAGEMSSYISMPYSNHSESMLNVTELLTVEDLSGTTPNYSSGLSAFNLPQLTDTAFYRSPIPYKYNSTVSENAEFLVKMSINTATISDPISKNDTLVFYQRFYNYFAPDDGTAEAGYGLTINGGQAAYKFKLNTPDTLRAVQMFFNRTVNDANQIYFLLRVWNDNNGVPGSVIYEKSGVRPEFEEGFNAFHNYILDEPIAVSGNIYVGWKQTSDEVLNLGYDKNTDRSNNLFYNTDGTWYNSIISGTPMIRIVVGKENSPHISINEYEKPIELFPNPCYNCQRIEFPDDKLKQISVIDINGRVVKQEWCEKYFDIDGIVPGFYTLKIDKKNLKSSYVKWILIN